MSDRIYLVVSVEADFEGGAAPYSTHQWPGDAIRAATVATTHDRLPRKIYEMKLIGETEAPIATFIDYRPKAEPA